MLGSKSFVTFSASRLLATAAAAQTWEPLTNPPTFHPGVMLLLTDAQ